MKVIFLDIDGVLNSRAYDRKRNWDEQTDIDETRLPLVKEIIERTGAEIVLSSTWREHWSQDISKCDSDGEYITRTFKKFGLEIYDKTPDIGRYAERRDEINCWLEAHPGEVDSFVIIDDYRYGWKELNANFVKTNPNLGLGLEQEHVEKAVEILLTGRNV